MEIHNDAFRNKAEVTWKVTDQNRCRRKIIEGPVFDNCWEVFLEFNLYQGAVNVSYYHSFIQVRSCEVWPVCLYHYQLLCFYQGAGLLEVVRRPSRTDPSDKDQALELLWWGLGLIQHWTVQWLVINLVLQFILSWNEYFGDYISLFSEWTERSMERYEVATNYEVFTRHSSSSCCSAALVKWKVILGITLYC